MCHTRQMSLEMHNSVTAVNPNHLQFTKKREIITPKMLVIHQTRK